MNAIDAYYESALRLVRPAGLIVLDNMLRRGRVADPNDTDTDTVALRSINTTKIAVDERVDGVLLPHCQRHDTGEPRWNLDESRCTSARSQ